MVLVGFDFAVAQEKRRVGDTHPRYLFVFVARKARRSPHPTRCEQSPRSDAALQIHMQVHNNVHNNCKYKPVHK